MIAFGVGLGVGDGVGDGLGDGVGDCACAGTDANANATMIAAPIRRRRSSLFACLLPGGRCLQRMIKKIPKPMAQERDDLRGALGFALN